MNPQVFSPRATALAALITCLAASGAAADRSRSEAEIVNLSTWNDTAGKPILAHDGGVSRFGDTFYWYGTSYEGNPTGQYGMARPRLWNGVLVYSSPNLVDWKAEGVALPRPEKGWGNLGTSGRPHVIYNATTKQYVMWYWFHPRDPAVFPMVAVADSPTGPFRPLGPREAGTWSGYASDLNVFQDDDGKAYLVYTDHTTDEGRTGGYAIRIDSLTDDYLSTNKEGALAIAGGCEAPAMIKHQGVYLVAASGVDGWGGSDTRSVMADSPLGPYGEVKLMSEQRTWGSQITSLFVVRESGTLVAMCDQWFTPDRGDLNASRYLWLPVEVDPAARTARMVFRERWNPWGAP